MNRENKAVDLKNYILKKEKNKTDTMKEKLAATERKLETIQEERKNDIRNLFSKIGLN